MSTEKMPDASGASMSEAMVIQYLREHPAFFNEHPDLLTEIDVPHASGDAVSLVARQVRILREQNEQNRKRLHELIEIARQNEELARRMHQLALTLMDADDTQQIFSTLYENLRRNFKADQVAVRLFAESARIDDPRGPEFVGTNTAEEQLFSAIIEKRLPLSGQLNKQQLAFFFGDAGADIRSAVMVPLHGPAWGGILAIGSTSQDRFQEGMGVELLANMGEILSLIIKPWIAEE